MKRFFYWLADRLRPLFDDGLPDELCLPENGFWMFHKGSMLRAAHLAQESRVDFGVFKILGPDYVPRALAAWRPGEILLMEVLSLAFFEVESRAYENIHVAQIHRDRLIEVLLRYYEYVRDPHSREEIEEKVEVCLQRINEARSSQNDESVGASS